MKITKTQLRLIIKEELNKVLKEDDVGAPIYDPLIVAQAAAINPRSDPRHPWLQIVPSKHYKDVRDSPVPENWPIYELLGVIGPEHVAKVFVHMENQSEGLGKPKDHLANGLISGEPEAVRNFSWFWAYEFETLDPSGIGAAGEVQ